MGEGDSDPSSPNKEEQATSKSYKVLDQFIRLFKSN